MRPAGKRPPPGSPEDWLAHAKSDLNLARLGKDRQEILPEQVCFHAQQAAEKALKEALLSRRIEFPLIHDIEELLELAEQGGLRVPPDVADAGSLTPYAEDRYERERSSSMDRPGEASPRRGVGPPYEL